MEPIKNVLLDLGGVLLNLDFAETEAGFARLGLTDFNRHFSQFKSSPLFEELETGAVTQSQFLAHFRQETGVTVPDQAIIKAWNAMLLDFPAERISWLDKLSDRYRVFLYSNTNAFHHDAFQESFSSAHPGKPFDDYFEKAYYSHILGKRKPYVESYHHLLQDAGIQAHETVFIDDTMPNIEGAINAGLKAIHLAPGTTVLDLDL
ncbi:HAD-IA family hydrolase [Flavihumibacter profundi]|uniref:HAD-IA family hydrolase n=1 Tax=Flavihumibacter profundi TaxID=2716883 RepID=UPI001CC418AF|nr:HAD-IA family hydrolase [Flavihumibacter profundi]MBZ5857818.1 HAD-IA family hydrolase [Flavihumibacter profundi]